MLVGKKPPNDTTSFTSLKSYENTRIEKEPYIAARLLQYPTDGLFTIGDGLKTPVGNRRKRRSVSEYTNQALKASQDYSWFQRACVDTVCCCNMFYYHILMGRVCC